MECLTETLSITNKRKTISNTMIKSQFNYCPLIWMFFLRKSSSLINKVQEKVFRINYIDLLTDFESLLLNHNELTTHQKNL